MIEECLNHAAAARILSPFGFAFDEDADVFRGHGTTIEHAARHDVWEHRRANRRLICVTDHILDLADHLAVWRPTLDA